MSCGFLKTLDENSPRHLHRLTADAEALPCGPRRERRPRGGCCGSFGAASPRFTSGPAPAAVPTIPLRELPRSPPQGQRHGGTEGERVFCPRRGSSGGSDPLPSMASSDSALVPPGRCVRAAGQDTTRRPAPGPQVLAGVGCPLCHGGGCKGHPGGGKGLGRGKGGRRGGVSSPSLSHGLRGEWG